MEACEEDRSILKRRLAASAVEIEKQVKSCIYFICLPKHLKKSSLITTNSPLTLQRMKCFP